MFSKIFIATLLASTAAATPVVARTASKPFRLIAFGFGFGFPVQGRDMVASNGALSILKETPSDDNLTTFVFDSNGRVGLNVIVPGGQQLYIATNTDNKDNKLEYTVPHSANTNGGKADGWTYRAPGGDEGIIGRLENSDYHFFACETVEGSDVWSIVASKNATAEPNCWETQLASLDYDGSAAYQYS